MKLKLQFAVLLSACAAAFHRITHPEALALSNGVVVRAGCRDTKLADEAIGRRIIVKAGSDADHIGVCDAADIPLGATEDGSAAAAEDSVAFAQFGLVENEQEATASGTVTVGDFVVPADNGKLRKLPTDAGTYYICGRAKLTATNGNPFNYVPCFPIQRVVAP